MSLNGEKQNGTTTPSSDTVIEFSGTTTQPSLSETQLSDTVTPPSDIMTHSDTYAHNTVDNGSLRRSQRVSKPTDNMSDYLAEEARKREIHLLNLYDRWRMVVKECRNALKSSSSEEELGNMMDSISHIEDKVIKQFESLRYCGLPNRTLVRKIDACVAISKDIIQIMNARISGTDDIDSMNIDILKSNQYASSVFSSLRDASQIPSDRGSTIVTSKLMDAAADLAMKKAELQSIKVEAELQEEKMKVVEHHEKELQQIQARKSIAIAEAKLQAYTDVINGNIETLVPPSTSAASYNLTMDTKEPKPIITRPTQIFSLPVYQCGSTPDTLPIHNVPNTATHFSTVYGQPRPAVTVHNSYLPAVSQQSAAVNNNVPTSDISGTSDNMTTQLAKAFADSVNLNRIPVPEPSVFTGDPLRYVEWKTAFHSLIEKKGIAAEERIFYLKRYIGGEAYAAIDGFFYGGSTSAYDSARKVLQERYGHPFVIQKAFRKKLDSWPKISDKDSKALRDFGDFLKACLDATPQIPSLQILNDCSENQKMISKLPNWATLRWNRTVQETLDSGRDYPTFARFVEFVLKEARIACNPVSSLYALNDLQGKAQRESKGNVGKVKVLAASTSDQSPNVSSDRIKTKVCEYCENSGHYIFKCSRFTALAIDEKRSFIQRKRLCFGCLRKGHINKDCKGKHICGICKRRHPTCLHQTTSNVPQTAAGRPPQITTSEATATSQATATSSASVSQSVNQGTSMIVPVWVSSEGNPSCEILTYALLDTQSDTTFILDELCEALRMCKQEIRLSLSTMTSMHTLINCSKVCNLRVRGFNSPTAVTIGNAYTRDFIPADRTQIPVRETAIRLDHLHQIVDKLQPLQSCDVGLLIGYNCPQALAPKKMIIGPKDQPFAVETVLGWSVVGHSRNNSSESTDTVRGISHRISVKELPPCSPKDVIKILEMDFAHDKPQDLKYSQEDISFLEFMKENIQQNEDKHLEMPLPFKRRPVLPNNKPLALLRLEHLKRKFARDKHFYEQYKEFMVDMINRKDAELVTSDGQLGNVWYIPHHGIFHPRKPDKLRVVFDCSARFKDTSLNQHLLTGPDLTNGLAGVLSRFRQHPIAIMCDIEKMFLQFVVKECDRDYLRFLWWKDGDCNTQPMEYRMNVHLFGAASSPGCANYGLKYLAKLQEEVLPRAASFIQRDFYVDDGLTSVQTVEEAKQLVKDAQTICKNGGLRLHKFVSSSKEVIDSISVSERATNVKELDLSLEQLPVEQALGVRWCVDSDVFNFKVNAHKTVPTRRNILSVVASIFDPLGFLAPLTLLGKMILQEMCKSGVGWNDELSANRRHVWDDWIHELQFLEQIEIPRCILPKGIKNVERIELHHFSDASTNGYGQCSYIRVVNQNEVYCALLIGKARVAPLKVVTIPRLELTAAVLSVKVSAFLRRELSLTIDQEFFWTDSRVVLGYINNDARRFHVFVANRVQMIKDLSDTSQWYYVDSNSNPADYASRGLRTAELAASSWFTGPKFLWQRHFNILTVQPDLQLGDPEVRNIQCFRVQTDFPCFLDYLDRFSSWLFIITLVARLQRLSNGVKGTHIPSVSERRNSEKTIVSFLQKDAFPDAINILHANASLPRSHPLYPFDPILQNGLLRVGSRLTKSDQSMEFKHPVILPKDSHITRTILAYAHAEIHHQGRGITLNKVRSMGYWIVGGSKTIAQFIRQCVICRKLRRPTECQKMANLPKDRLEPTPPFTYCGMDCFGPFMVKQGRKELKRYGLIFTCMCSRAVHIEMLDDMTTDAFINGLHCFIALRGEVRQIRSDQGSNFIGAKNEFEVNKTKVISYLAGKQCDFVMNAPDSSHTGGVWERQIRTVRSILNAVLQLCPGRLDDSSLRTVFYEVMSIVNSRPLTVSEIDDPKTLEPLTPNHILTGKSSIPLPPPGEFVKEDIFLRKRWRRVQYILEQFWSRWRKEYLAQLSLRQKWHGVRRNLHVGDIVLIKDIDLPRNHWSLAKVVVANQDDDGLVRRVCVKLANANVLERSIHKLVVLLESNQ